MDKYEFFLNAINTLRKMEHDGTPAASCAEFDRFVRENIFGAYKIELPFEELVALQDYYIATL